jgi:hypothetical protein
MVRDVSWKDGSDFVPQRPEKGKDNGILSKAHEWVDEYVKGDKEDKTKDFMKTVGAGAAVGAGVGTFLGVAKGIKNISDAEPVKTEVRHEIMEDKLKGYDQHADPFNGKWSLKFSPSVRHEKVGEYTSVEYSPPSVMDAVKSGMLGMLGGAIGGGVIAAVVKVIRDIVLSRE